MPTHNSTSDLQEIDLNNAYDLQRKLSTGRFGDLFQARHRETGRTVSLKLFPRRTKGLRQSDFLRDYNLGRSLAVNESIVLVYAGAYCTPEYYLFTQEFPFCGTLDECIEKRPHGLGEDKCKRIMTQVMAALEFMHSRKLVHRNIQAANVLIFDVHFCCVKLNEFSLTKKEGTQVKNYEPINPYHAPELCDVLQMELYVVDKAIDVWAAAILLYYCVRGEYPWDQARFLSRDYWEWRDWVLGKAISMPEEFGTGLSDRLVRMLKKALHPNFKDRCRLKEMQKVLVHQWTTRVRSTEDRRSEEDAESLKLNNGSIHELARRRQSCASAPAPCAQEQQVQEKATKKSGVFRWMNSTFQTLSML